MLKRPNKLGQPFAGATKPHEDDVLMAVSQILGKYDIDAESEMADIIYRTLHKFILGLDEKLKAYNDWFDRHGKKINKIKTDYSGSYPQDCVELAMRFNIEVTPEYDRLLKIDMGRNKVLINAYTQLHNHRWEIGPSHYENPAFAVLGSIVRRAIDIHKKHNDETIEANIERHPDIAIAAIKALRGMPRNN